MFIILVMNFDWWDVPENIHSQASLSSGEPIKCRVSLFSRGQKTILPIISLVSYFFTCESYHGDYHSCPIGSVSIVRKIIQIRCTNGFQRRISLKKMREKRFLAYATSEEEKYIESMENKSTREKTKRDVQLRVHDEWSERHLKKMTTPWVSTNALKVLFYLLCL